MSSKKCISCFIEKNISFFEKGKNQCKNCRKKRRQQICIESWQNPGITVICTKCKKSKKLTLDNFEGRKNVKCGYRKECRECVNFKESVHFIPKEIVEECFICKKTTYEIILPGRVCKNCLDTGNTRFKEYRKRKREEDEVEYLRHQNEIQRNWCNKNKDHLKDWRTKNIIHRYTSLKQQAIKKGLEFSISKDFGLDLMTKKCIYCGYLDLDKTVNGIDRLDSYKGYIIDNCVSCCSICNYMKCCLDPITFIDRCRHISEYINFEECFRNSKNTTFYNYKLRATKKNLSFELSKEEFNYICKSSCTYCKRKASDIHKNGVDRIDNNIGYTIINSASCCSDCNYMKKWYSKESFLEKCRKISDNFLSEKYLLDYKDIKTNKVFNRISSKIIY